MSSRVLFGVGLLSAVIATVAIERHSNRALADLLGAKPIDQQHLAVLMYRPPDTHVVSVKARIENDHTVIQIIETRRHDNDLDYPFGCAVLSFPSTTELHGPYYTAADLKEMAPDPPLGKKAGTFFNRRQFHRLRSGKNAHCPDLEVQVL